MSKRNIPTFGIVPSERYPNQLCRKSVKRICLDIEDKNSGLLDLLRNFLQICRRPRHFKLYTGDGGNCWAIILTAQFGRILCERLRAVPILKKFSKIGRHRKSET